MELVRELMKRSISRSSVDERRPVLVFEGVRGSGKSALLARLAELADQRVPYAYLNFEAAGQSRARVPQVLSALALGLNRRCPFYGRLRFPRLVIGQLVTQLTLDTE